MTEARQTHTTRTVPIFGLALFFALFLAFMPTVWLLQVDPKLVAIFGVVMLLIIVTAADWRESWRPLSTGISFALLICLLCPHQYERSDTEIGGIDLFPLVLWTGGLVLTWWVYAIVTIRHRLLLVSLAHLLALFLIEYFGYYVVGIRLATGGPSLFGLGIIHGTPLLHMFYVATGPSYLIVMSIVTRPKGLPGVKGVNRVAYEATGKPRGTI